jgi:hypothetical protein
MMPEYLVQCVEEEENGAPEKNVQDRRGQYSLTP